MNLNQGDLLVWNFEGAFDLVKYIDVDNDGFLKCEIILLSSNSYSIGDYVHFNKKYIYNLNKLI